MKSTLLAALLLTSVASTLAADYRQNPFTLVYDGAITTNVSGRVNIHQVKYDLNGVQIAANVYTPAHYDPAKHYPAIIVAHPDGGVKEQVAGLYAQRLAEQGYITLCADAAYHGASGGLPRNIVKPANRIEDIHGMADYLGQYPGVDADRIGLLGIGGGGGYSLAAVQTDKRFKALATLSMVDPGLVHRNGDQDSLRATVQSRLAQATQARIREVTTGEVSYSADETLTHAQIAKLPFALYREGDEYYRKTHVHPNATFRYTTSSLIALMCFDALSNLALINQPLLLMVGTHSHSRSMTESAFKKATGTRNKELFLIDNATHIDTWWMPRYVDMVMNKLTTFFSSTL